MSKPVRRLLTPFQSFVKSESSSGILLVVVSLIAFAWAVSPWGDAYEHLKEIPVGIEFGTFHLEKHLLHWVNDGLMAIFFLFVGLEIKRELRVGELSSIRAAALPCFAALGGMVIPAGIYAAQTAGTDALRGWGVPMATDIAFALGIMALLGPRVPIALKVFLTALAIVDDLGAVAVIALFYTEDLSLAKLGLSLLFWGLAMAFSALGGRRLSVFALLGVVSWYFMLKSGVHATVAGVLLALAIPLGRELEPSEIKERLASLFRSDDFERGEVELEHVESLVNRAQSPLHELEHSLAPWVAFAIMPVFAFFNAGFQLSEEASLGSTISLAAFLGLVVGKPVGVVAFSWLAVRLGWARLPSGVGWGAMLGAGLLAGIGFTMSLFIAALAFGQGGALDQAKLGVLSASVVSAILGLIVLARTLPKHPEE